MGHLWLPSYSEWPTAMVITLSQQCASLPRWYHRPDGTSKMACGTSTKRIRSPLLRNARKACYSLCVLSAVCSLFAPVAAFHENEWTGDIHLVLQKDSFGKEAKLNLELAGSSMSWHREPLILLSTIVAQYESITHQHVFQTFVNGSTHITND